ncbi:D-alanyl-D-alanine carboxypeptidase/D-alanyl-D-alanine endopeptidase [Pontibacter harenae]|uniref:D-alanyl-D-alanine carboxypeptidase/D-alanyl-D-alanine endopeptidase n=1 Tax=Pontibacter harenae TaxID=2894083 RepID=UPI001E5CB41B|nr:D-alanyl-D-alanine carboxypeptidase/D-alanyl-D-alanine-endopeptidase [Pontibacter harenae]MCC9168063.1 D-alanyl-D-alanine carboxypeptidase/D-alanyl-D-alanine-endopeptidase [Pontibacter harenae]
MKLTIVKASVLVVCAFIHTNVLAQSVSEKLTAAFKTFQNDPQLSNGIASLYVVDAKTGQVVFDKNSSVGLAPASTQKIITSASAYELLGADFRYKTTFAYQRGQQPSLIILPSGDPTFGSWRWPETQDGAVMKGLARAIRNTGIKSFNEVQLANNGWNEETIPDGWMWQDVGNYYGAGPAKLNWRENQYDVHLKSGSRIGDPVTIVKTVPRLHGFALRSELTSAAAGTGDNAYIYFPLNAATGAIRGTIPINESSFKISGAVPSASQQFLGALADTLKQLGIQMPKTATLQNGVNASGQNFTPFHTVTSPPLDSIIFWFNRKSINLYGEALLKTIAYKNSENGSTAKGVKLVKEFWKGRGIAESELNIVDGSGLSPLNRVTTHAQVKVLQHAQKQAWFNGFYTSLPLYNGMKMKSGTIRGVKGFCGYHRSKDGKEYVFAFLVNNYNGSTSGVVQKMYKVLNELK